MQLKRGDKKKTVKKKKSGDTKNDTRNIQHLLRVIPVKGEGKRVLDLLSPLSS